MEDKYKKILYPVIIFTAVIVGWEIFVHVAGIRSYLLPSPSRIAVEFAANAKFFFKEISITLLEFVGGLGLGLAAGVILAIIISYFKNVGLAIYPLILAIRSLPKVAIAPIIIVWFGAGYVSMVIVSFLFCFFPVLINTASGLMDIDPGMIELFHSMRATKLQIYRKVRIPHALPYLMDGIKIGLPAAMIGAILGEFLAAESGLGWMIIYASSIFKIPLMFAGVIFITVITIAIWELFILIDKRVVWWRGR